MMATGKQCSYEYMMDGCTKNPVASSRWYIRPIGTDAASSIHMLIEIQWPDYPSGPIRMGLHYGEAGGIMMKEFNPSSPSLLV